MQKRLFILAAFLGALGIILFWFSCVIENIENSAVKRGKAECTADYEAKSVKAAIIKEEKKQNVDIQKAKIRARPNSRLFELIKRMRECGIGTVDSNLPGCR